MRFYFQAGVGGSKETETDSRGRTVAEGYSLGRRTVCGRTEQLSAQLSAAGFEALRN